MIWNKPPWLCSMLVFCSWCELKGQICNFWGGSTLKRKVSKDRLVDAIQSKIAIVGKWKFMLSIPHTAMVILHCLSCFSFWSGSTVISFFFHGMIFYREKHPISRFGFASCPLKKNLSYQENPPRYRKSTRSRRNQAKPCEMQKMWDFLGKFYLLRHDRM